LWFIVADDEMQKHILTKEVLKHFSEENEEECTTFLSKIIHRGVPEITERAVLLFEKLLPHATIE